MKKLVPKTWEEQKRMPKLTVNPGEKENTELVKQQWILPPFSYPPGFTVNFYTYHNRLNFHIVFSRKHVDSEQINTFKTTLIHLLTQK